MRDVEIPLVDLAVVNGLVADGLREAFERVLARSAFIGGHEVERFEAALARRLGVAHAVGVGSGTAALHLALAAAGVGRGDEVILPANTFVATAEAVHATGATPVLADVDRSTALLDAEAVEAALGPRTAAIMAVHLYGQPVDGDRFNALARRQGLLLVEDAAQAMGAAWRETEAGAIGDAAGISFYPAKNLGALGDGGAVTTDDDAIARRVRLLRSHGEARRHEHLLPGLTERLDGLQAAFLSVKLAEFDRMQRLRLDAVERYHGMLAQVPGARTLTTAPGARHAHHLMVVCVPERHRVLSSIRARGVGAAVHYPTPIHLQPAFAGLGALGAFPVAEELASSVLSLPMYPGMRSDQVDRCLDALAGALEQVA